ncbi:type II toxin-antitoxin system PemK/MazF family toxin [Marinimicrobium sp. ABcell2]|uniref:type II toxin-antitoxin system PemK/MazF family toxin n=1 Tax=Marinimicrobium sp. ABcell2 TaxID=3069751 RepID=UPI0027B7E56B|nr:type II toxin-antitoxin system PemK/MazF family toxin [Marinimicrobium sp. ABcell2]MDQ2075145.1 type II toxin-antitoxin system PemK/MazF family toxin [Marinimicrobium sp. ABcell2]
MYTPEQGDIIEIDFDPSAGKEIMKRRPAFVLSRQQFNDHTEFAIVAPITSTVRGVALEVELPQEGKTHGSILVHQMRSLDFRARRATFIEQCPKPIREKVTQIAKLLVS